MSGNGFASTGAGRFDSSFFTIVYRRKFVVLLLGLIGAGLGYLHYINDPDVYQSSLDLMIETSAPTLPTTLSEMTFQESSLDRFAKLASSDFVYSKAAGKEGLKSLKTFRDSSSIIGWLKSNVRVTTGGKKGGDVLVFSVTGPDATELPKILNSVASSFESVVIEDNKAAGKESAELITELLKKMVQERNSAKKKQLKLLESLSLATRDQSGNFENPFQNQYKAGLETRSRLEEEIKQLSAKLVRLSDSLKSKNDSAIELAYLEARNFFELSRLDENSARFIQTYPSKVNRLSNQLETIEEKISELEIDLNGKLNRRKELSRVLGKKNMRMLQANAEIELLQTQMKRRLKKKEQIQAELKLAETEIRGDRSGFSKDKPHVKSLLGLYQLSLNRSVSNAKKELSALEKKFSEVEKNYHRVASNIFELKTLENELETKKQEIDKNTEKVTQLNLLSNKYHVTKIKNINHAKEGVKISPRLSKSLGIGGMLGILFGVGLAFLTDKAEATFRSPQEIFERLGLPVVGRVPRVPVGKIRGIRGNPALVAKHKPASRAAEAFRAIRTSIFFSNTNNRMRTIMFTSPSPGDGKSTVAANVAISLASTGKSVCLVDADFRRPRVHTYFDEKNKPGILGILNGSYEVADALQESFQENLFLLPSGGRPDSPGDVVTSPEFENLLESVADQFDFVIVDTPPVLPVSDAMVISNYVDGAYMVMRIRKGVKLTAQKTKETLESVDGNLLGVIVNCVDDNPSYKEYGYGYSYTYSGSPYEYGGYYDSKALLERERGRSLTKK